ncbi:unnamed protein product [Closterium sp. NIES-54]
MWHRNLKSPEVNVHFLETCNLRDIRADLRDERADLRDKRADLGDERADLRDERADLRDERVDCQSRSRGHFARPFRSRGHFACQFHSRGHFARQSFSLGHFSPPPPSLPPPQSISALLPVRFLLLRAFQPSSPLASSSSGHSSPPPPRFLLRAFQPSSLLASSTSQGHSCTLRQPHLQHPLACLPPHLQQPRSRLACDLTAAALSAGLPPHLQQHPSPPSWLACMHHHPPQNLRLACLLICSSLPLSAGVHHHPPQHRAGLLPHLQQPPLPTGSSAAAPDTCLSKSPLHRFLASGVVWSSPYHAMGVC